MKTVVLIVFMCIAMQSTIAQNKIQERFLPPRKLHAQIDNNRELPEVERKRRKMPNQGMRRIRRKIFTVNILRFNKKIRDKHDKDVEALARYEARLKKQVARKNNRKQNAKDRKNARNQKKEAK